MLISSTVKLITITMYLVKDRAYLSTDIIVLNSGNNPTEIEGAQRIGFETVEAPML